MLTFLSVAPKGTMRRMKLLLSALAAAVLILPPIARADDASHKAAAESLRAWAWELASAWDSR